MPRRYHEDGSEIVVADQNAVPVAVLREVYDRLAYEMLQRVGNAFFGDSFTVSFASATSVNVKKGLGFQTDLDQESPEPERRPLFLPEDVNTIVGGADSVNDRIDLVCVKNALIDELTGTRKVKDAISDVISNESLVVQQDWEAEILMVEGTPGVSPVAPSVPTGYIAIASLLITAGVGLDSGDITDLRTLMPIGGAVTIDTSLFARITADPALALDQALLDIDTLLKYGHLAYTDLDELAVAPSSPGATKQRLYLKDNILYRKTSAGVATPVGSGGGGGGGANWQPVSGLSPVEDYEYDEKIWKFETGSLEALTLWVRVPTSYIAGTQVSMKASFYSPSAANMWKMQAVAALIRKNNDAIDGVANLNTANSGDITNAVAKRMREISITLSDSGGLINSLAISPGDIIKVTLSRIAPSGTDDTADVRFIPSSTEVSFT